MGEYLFVLCFHNKELKWDSFLINQSNAYVIAAVVSWVEFFIEYPFKPKQMTEFMVPIGLIFITIGHYLRISAMFTARKSFHHVVQNHKAETHTLITTGVYAYFRHPSYFGWSIWALGT